MKIIEESILKQNIRQLNNYKKANKEVSEFYNNLDSFELASLQSVSFEQDNAFFDEISFILNVIASIISHPHLSNVGEDVVMRSELAGHLTVESIQRTMRESSFWKEKDLDMKPEYVHHFKYTDELKIYENIFIGVIIKVLDHEVSEYIDFYNQLIPSIDGDNSDSLLEDDNIEIALKKLSVLRRKLRFVKNTHFFKEVSKVKFSLKNLQPTNILVKDRLYNHCYRFYKKYIKYIDQKLLETDFSTYYYYLILKACKKKEFILDIEKNQKFTNLHFINGRFRVNLIKEGNSSILMKIAIDGKKHIVNHRLVISKDREVLDLAGVNQEGALTIELATLWNIKDSLDLNRYVFKNKVFEDVVAEYWINSKFDIRQIKQNMFEKYCPVCKCDNLDENEEIYTCAECGTKYKFIDKNTAWFLKIRRL